jgi:two-component system response regulator VanR
MSHPERRAAAPFRFAELVARLRALGRRTGEARPPVLEAGDVVLDPAKRTATRAGLDLDLTLKEFAVLQALLEAQGAVVTPEELLERAWDEQVDPLTNSVRMVVMTLRRKLGEPQAIVTVPGAGYRL